MLDNSRRGRIADRKRLDLISFLKKLWSEIFRSYRSSTNPPSEKRFANLSDAKEQKSLRKEDTADFSNLESSENKLDTKPSAARRSRRKKACPAAAWDRSAWNVEPVEGKTRFHDLDLPDEIMHAVADLGFQYCTPIQSEILPATLTGKDAGGKAQTGTGKTAAFLITVLTRLLRNPRTGKIPPGVPRILVLAPTRELVMQIAEEARALSKHTPAKIAAVFGGMDYDKQRRQLSEQAVDIVVATPGRLLDFQRQKDVHLDKVETLIIDEADRMLDMGFIPDVRKIIYSTPHKSKRQTLLFSATLTPEVTRLAAQWTRDPIMVEIEPEHVAVETVDQVVYIVTTEEKYALLYNIITQMKLQRVIVFCNRKDETRRLADLLSRYRIDCAVLSGDVRQRTRVRTLENFKNGKIRVLVATDVAGRGIHIEGMDHVINYTLPRDPEDYVHRIGRTGRAGAAGTSISFADEEDSFAIPAIEALIGRELPCTHPQEEWLQLPPPPPRRKPKPRSNRSTPSSTRQPRNTGGSGRSRRRRGTSKRKIPKESSG